MQVAGHPPCRQPACVACSAPSMLPCLNHKRAPKHRTLCTIRCLAGTTMRSPAAAAAAAAHNTRQGRQRARRDQPPAGRHAAARQDARAGRRAGGGAAGGRQGVCRARHARGPGAQRRRQGEYRSEENRTEQAIGRLGRARAVGARSLARLDACRGSCLRACMCPHARPQNSGRTFTAP